MSNKTNDILPGDGPMDPRKWMDYLDGKLSPEEQHRLEDEIAQSEFLREALEGLRPPENVSAREHTAGIDAVVHQLNLQLRQQLAQKKTQRKRKELFRQSPTEIAIVVIVTLCMIGYFLYRQLHHQP